MPAKVFSFYHLSAHKLKGKKYHESKVKDESLLQDTRNLLLNNKNTFHIFKI